MTSKPGEQTTAIHILLNISRSKNNLILKFSQLIEYIMRKLFFKNHAQNVADKLF